MKKRKIFLCLVAVSMLVLQCGCSSAEKSINQNVKMDTTEVSDVEEESAVTEKEENGEYVTAEEWVESLGLETPTIVVWNNQTRENSVLEDNQEYQLMEGDQVLLAGHKGMDSMMCDPSETIADIESYRNYFELSLNIKGKQKVTFEMDFDGEMYLLSVTFIAPLVMTDGEVEKYSSYQMVENDWPKGTIEEYIYNEDASYAHYVIKIDDPEGGYGDVVTGEKGILMNYTCDLPCTDRWKISVVGQQISMNGSSRDGEGYMCFFRNMEITAEEFDKFAGYEKEDFWDYITAYPRNECSEDAYYEMDVQENEIRAFIEGSRDGKQFYVGCFVDKEKNEMLKFEYWSSGEQKISDETITRFVDSLQIIDADYVEEY